LDFIPIIFPGQCSHSIFQVDLSGSFSGRSSAPHFPLFAHRTPRVAGGEYNEVVPRSKSLAGGGARRP
jgi:hypothetical protein